MYAPNCFQNKKYIFRPNFKIEWIPPWNDKRLGWKFVSLLHFLCDSIIVHIKWSITIILFIFSPQGLPWNQTCQFEYIIEPWFNCVCATSYKYYRPIAMHFRILIDTKMFGFDVPFTYLYQYPQRASYIAYIGIFRYLVEMMKLGNIIQNTISLLSQYRNHACLILSCCLYLQFSCYF